MFDDLREPNKENETFQDALGFGSAMSSEPPSVARPRSSPGFMGLSSPQRFVLALLLLPAVCVLGTMCLLITGRISAF